MGLCPHCKQKILRVEYTPTLLSDHGAGWHRKGGPDCSVPAKESSIYPSSGYMMPVIPTASEHSPACRGVVHPVTSVEFVGQKLHRVNSSCKGVRKKAFSPGMLLLQVKGG